MKRINAQHAINIILRISAVINSILFQTLYFDTSGPGSIVGIATAYGLDGPGIESRCGRDFAHLSISALRPTQPPVQWVPGLSRG